MVVQNSFMTSAACVTPGTSATARAAAGKMVKLCAVCEEVTVASAPAVCQDAATSPLVTASRTMPAKAATVSARTRASAGSAGVRAAVRDARARPRNAGARELRAEARSSPRSTSGYSRSTTITAGMATSIGAELV